MKKLMIILFLLASVLIALAVSNPDESDFREWYVDEHGFEALWFPLPCKEKTAFSSALIRLVGQPS